MTGSKMYRARLDYGLSTIYMSTATMRKLTIVAVTASLLGALIQDWFSSQLEVGLLLGGLLMALGLFAGIALIATRAYNVVEGRPGPRGEYEQRLRMAGKAGAYTILSKLIIVAFAYVLLAADLGFWFPRDKSDWHLLFLLTVNLLMILPTTVLVWSGKLDDELAEGE
jgi:hypothetical protein